MTPGRVVELARAQGCVAVAFTYNEPTIFAEYVIDVARECRAQGLATVMVTNGYITREALDEVYPWIDAANVDLKAFTEDFYRKITLSHMQPVLDAIVRMRELGTWIELTTLLIPGLNDGDDEIGRMCDWILGHVGQSVPLHFTAYHPDYKLTDRPQTPPETLFRARRLALQKALNSSIAAMSAMKLAHYVVPGMRADPHPAGLARGDEEPAPWDRPLQLRPPDPGTLPGGSSGRSDGHRRSLMVI